MSTEKRYDQRGAMVINAAIQIATLWGCVSAWRYLAQRHVLPGTAARILSKAGPRRNGDAQHPAVRDALARRPAVGMAQRVTTATVQPVPRHNLSTEATVEQAILLMGSIDRHYAETLLAIYGLDPATIMRVLFAPHQRRRPPGHLNGVKGLGRLRGAPPESAP
jgi:hypothetical protein